MATIATTSDRNMSIGRVFSRAFATIGAQPVTMFGIAFLFGAVPKLATTQIFQLRRFPADYSMPWMIASSFGGALLMLVCGLLTQGALVRATIAYSEGRRARFAECALTGLRNILPLLAIGLLYGIAVTLGLIVMIVPGIVLYIIWGVAAPAAVAERCGVFGAFSRSAALTKGARWNILALDFRSSCRVEPCSTRHEIDLPKNKAFFE